MDVLNYVLIGLIALVVVICAITSFSAWRKKKKADKVEQNKSGQAQTSGTNAAEIMANISVGKGDIVVPVQTTLKAEKGGVIQPGRYTVLSSASGEDKFNVRLGKFVRECKHGDVIVLAEGDEITPTSVTIILR